MANEPSLKINDIFDIDDYLDELEGKEPEVHSGTLRKEELDDINDRAAELVPEYQPITTGISLSNLISIKENTIDKEPTPEPEPEEDILVRFYYADPFCLGIKRDFDINDEYWTKVPDTGPAYDAWNPKDDSGISCSFMGHTFTGSDVWLYSGYKDDNYEIEVDHDAIDREGIEQTTVKVPITLTFPKGAFLSGTTPSKVVDYSFTFTDDLNGGAYPYKKAIIDTSDPTVTCERQHDDIVIDGHTYAHNKYSLPDSSVFKNQTYDGTIQPLIQDDVFNEIILLINDETREFTIDELSDSDGSYDVNTKNGDCVGTLYPGDNNRGFEVTLPGKELQPK